MKSLARLSLLGLLCLAPAPARAADHQDGMAVLTDPSTDIADVYAWMNPNKLTVNLIMTVFPAAGPTARFSNAAYYVFHTTSRTLFSDVATQSLDIVCQFSSDAQQIVVCYAGSDISNAATGNASVTAGVTSQSGNLQVFAGLRRDPFFFNLAGFQATAAVVHTAYPTLTLDDNGCPAFSASTQSQLVKQLQTAADGSAPVDYFATQDVLAIVVQVNTNLISPGGPIVSVWGATYKMQ